jgi:hypothetical protein
MHKQHLEELRSRVQKTLSDRGFRTYKDCYEAFNDYYSEDIDKGLVAELNKDFISRFFNSEKFSLSNQRFAKFCEFLKIDMGITHTPQTISKTALRIDELLKQRPDLEKHINSVVTSMTEISSYRGVTGQ